MFTYAIQAVSLLQRLYCAGAKVRVANRLRWAAQDTIRVQARDFGKDPAEAIKQEIHRRYANKASTLGLIEQRHGRADWPWRMQVIPEVGLCISLLDIIECSEGAVLYGDGCFYYKCKLAW